MDIIIMKNILTIIARIEAKADKIELVKSSLINIIEPTRMEEGCLQYDLHQDNDHPEVFIFYENRQSHTSWQTHMKSDHLKAHREETYGAIQSFMLNEMSKVSMD